MATKICGFVDMSLQTNNEKLISPEREMYEHVITALRSQLTDEAFTIAWTEAHALTLEEGIEFVLEARDG